MSQSELIKKQTVFKLLGIDRDFDLAWKHIQLLTDLSFCNRNNQNLLHYSCREGLLDITAYLLEKNVDLHQKDSQGNTPLHFTVLNNHFKILELLFGKGGQEDVNIQNESGYTPLHLAVRYLHTDMVKVLLEHGALVNVRDKTNKYAAEHLRPHMKQIEDQGIEPSNFTAEQRQATDINELLQCAKDELDSKLREQQACMEQELHRKKSKDSLSKRSGTKSKW